jgi:hypothetical protein
MLPLAKRLGLAALFGVAGFGLSAAPAQAQAVVTPLPQPAPLRVLNPFVANPNLGLQYANNLALLGQAYRSTLPWAYGALYNPYVPTPTPYYTCFGFCPGGGQLYANVPAYGGNYGGSPGLGAYGGGSPGYGYGGWPGYWQDPYNGYLTGAASVISSQGQFAKDWQTSRLMKEQVKQARIDTQRKMIEEWQYERNNQPTLEQIRRDNIERAWQRAVFHPPLNDVWSADALNRILDHASRIQGGGAKGRDIPLDEETVNKINVSTGVAGNIGALKDKGKLTWPTVLEKSSFDEERDRFSQLAKAAVDQARANNRVQPTTLKQMEEDLKSMTGKLSARVSDLDPSDYMDAKRYLKELSLAMKILKRQDVGKYLDGEYKAEGATAGQLIKNMTTKGLRFAPAAQGSEAAYNALYQALVAYDLDLAKGSPGKE